MNKWMKEDEASKVTKQQQQSYPSGREKKNIVCFFIK